MRKVINHSFKYKQVGLKVQLKENKVTVTKGVLYYDKEYSLDKNVTFTIDEEIVIIYLVEDLITGEILIAASDGGIDKAQYRLIEQVAWKTEQGWERLSVEPYPKPPKAGKYNYEGLNEKAIKEGLKIQSSLKRVIGPDGIVKTERAEGAIS